MTGLRKIPLFGPERPVDDNLLIRYQTPDFEWAYSWRIYDAAGRLVYDETFAPPSFEAKFKKINAENWPSGVYFLMLSGAKTRITKKNVKI